MNLRTIRFAATALTVCLVSAAVAAIAPLVVGQAYEFDGFLVTRQAEGRGAARTAVWLSAHANGEAPRGMAGRQDIELAPSKDMTAKALMSLARTIGADKKVTVKGKGGAKNVLKVDEITPAMPRVQPRPRPQPQPRPLKPNARVEVTNAKIEGNVLVLTCMATPCTQQRNLMVKTSEPAETDPVQATLWVERPHEDGCMMAVMPSPMTLKVDLKKQFPGVKNIALTIESLGGEGFSVDARIK
jgi:hypothetical protein